MLGQLPAVAMVDEIEAGRCRALLVTGGNPITAFPEPARMRRALRSLETFVVVDVMESELTQLATHVLPATGQLERADLTLAEATSVRSGIQATRPVVAPVAQRRPVWWMLASLSRRMGRDALGGVDPDVMTDEAFLRGVLARSPLDATAVFDAGPRGTDVEIEHGWVRGSMLAGGRWRIAPDVLVQRLDGHADPNPDLEGSLVLAPRREMGWSNSVRYGGAGLEPVARVHPSDAARCNVSDGAHAVVTSPHGSIRVVVAVEGNVRAGVVSVTHGHADQSPGELTSSRAGVDPLTTMPHASGLPVTLAPDPTI